MSRVGGPDLKAHFSRGLLVLGGLVCLMTGVSSALALLGGLGLAFTIGNIESARTKTWSPKLLSWSVIGLGAGMNLVTVTRVGLAGLGVTFLSIFLTLSIGLLLGRWLRTDRETSVLISVGTAICGGSAIAAVSPVIKAKPHSIAVALGTVFLLNSLALVLFPFLGRHFQMTPEMFAWWSALAIHDTSSVVGASLEFGAEALKMATTIKLARALWIVPVTLVIAIALPFFEGDAAKAGPGGGLWIRLRAIKKPWFILGFLMMAAIVTWLAPLSSWINEGAKIIEMVARRGLVLTLFLIGANLNRETLRAVGLRPLVQGILLWLLISVAGLVVVVNFPAFAS